MRFFILILSFCLTSPSLAQKIDVIIDSDTGNEVDDLYALSSALIEPSWNVLALNATHWQTSQWAEAETMENSHRLNQVLLGYLGKNIKTCRGGHARMYDWGDQARHSAAAYEIIKQAKAKSNQDKLMVIALGALTNVASALYIDPSIENKIQLYWLGSTYDFEKGILRKNDFNCMMDIQALDLLLFSKVEMHIIPINVASKMTFDFADTNQQLTGTDLGDFLIKRWANHLDGGRKVRVIWDLALVEGIINPDWRNETLIQTSKDNGARGIYYWQDIDAVKMKASFFSKLEAYLNKQ